MRVMILKRMVRLKTLCDVIISGVSLGSFLAEKDRITLWMLPAEHSPPETFRTALLQSIRRNGVSF